MRSENSKPRLKLLKSADQDFFLDCIDEFYATIAKDTRYEVIQEVSSSGRLKPWILRKLQDFKLLYKLDIRLGDHGAINFASMISGDFRIIVPAAFFSRRNYIYMYDVWPRFHRWIFPLLDVFNITYVFFSSKQVFEDYQRKYPQSRCKAMWLPEALDSNEYTFLPPAERSIDVLEFGRIYDDYHHRIVNELSLHKKNHLYRSAGMPVLFEGKAAFTEALSKSRVVICTPSNITHPERAEYISTMTLRYLQAMASKCLIIGVLPSDMEEAFGYNPIVEIDMPNAGAQIIHVLDNFDTYQSLIEKNYAEVKARHQWQNRWEIIESKIEEKI
ncbi:glycosyltransferase [Pedobacter westerhofensis]|nr:glycosyltransferase [Pedobacter westerhofensis]